jgi:hypothetical protein
MAMRQITIVNVGAPQQTSKGGRSWENMEVIYKDDSGKAGTKKLASFSNPQVFKFIQGLNSGDQIWVENVKVGDFWQWSSASHENTGSSAAPSGGSQVSESKGSTRVVGSNYETKEERQVRQIMIVRQSSLGHAVATFAVGGKTAPTPEAVIEVAKMYEQYVLGGPETIVSDIVE